MVSLSRNVGIMEWAAALERQRARFQRGLPVDDGVVSGAILASWQRSRAYGLDEPGRERVPLSAEAFAEAEARNRDLLESATTMMEKLYTSISAAHSLIGLADSTGLILHVVGREEDISRLGVFRKGYFATEAEAGTNGLGTCLVEQRPLEIIGCEHYAGPAQSWCCSACPIRDDRERLAGVLNVSIATESFHHHTLGMVEAAAHAISEQLRLRTILREQRAMLEVIDEGVIIVNGGGLITAMNDRARRMLQIAPRAGDAADLHIRDVIASCPMVDAALASPQRFNDVETQIQLPHGVLQCTLSAAPVAPVAPVDAANGLVFTLRETRRMREYATRTVGAKAAYTFEDIVGQSTAIREVVRLARMATQSDITTLILGESGTGKELFAQSIHNAGSRRRGPFVVVNCGALPRTLVESELFGYEEGAFTGASRMGKPGKFELADEGTIFLDEIGEMPLDAQASLLRLLQEHELTRVGGSKPRRVNIRVIAATNRNLEELVRQKGFREDLYYRLNVLTLSVPPLRERRSDIRLLAQHFLSKFAKTLGKTAFRLSEEALEALALYGWPGNIRELENTIERVINISPEPVIEVRHLPAHILQQSLQSGQSQENPAGLLQARELEAILEVLRSTGGNMRAAAMELGIARSALYRKVGRLGLSPDMWRRR